MNKSVLVLEENSVIHGLVGSALDIDGLTLHHEFNPNNFVERAKSLMPDLILISNADQGSDYTVCRELKSGDALGGVPVILLANSNETIDPEKLAEVRVDGVVRKPFEASDLQQQVSKHLDMVDLIGAAYEYKQSQSIDDKPDPLADLQVVDSDVLGLLQGVDGPQLPAMDVQPAARPGETQVDVAPAAGLDESTLDVDEGMLEEALQPEAAFEPVDLPVDEPLLDEPRTGLADEATFLADQELAPEAEPELTFGEMHGIDELGDEEMEFGQEEDIEELGPADLLDEEMEGAAPLPPAFDQALEGEGVATVDSMPLEQIEVELSEGEVDFDALGDDLQHEEVDLFEAGSDEEGAGQTGGETEDIPLAVRRMMELKPIFPSQDDDAEDGGVDSAEEFVSLISSEGETGSFDDDLGTLDDIELDDSAQAEFPAVPDAEMEPDLPVWTPPEDEVGDTLTGEEGTWTPPEESSGDALVEEESTWTPLEDEGGDTLIAEEGTWTPPEESSGDALVEEESTWTPLEDEGGDTLIAEESTWTPPEESSGDALAEEESTWTPLEDEGGDTLTAEESTWTPPEESAPDMTGEEDAGVGSLDEADEEEFKEEYLGDEELDEDRILAAMQEAEAADEEEFGGDLDEFETEDSELDEMVALSDADISGELIAAGTGEDESELVLDQDEEAMMMASLEEEAAFGGAIADSPAAEEFAEEFAGDMEQPLKPFSADEDVPPIDPQFEQIGTEALGELEDSIAEVESMQAPEEPMGGASMDDDFSLSVEGEGESTFMDDLSAPAGGTDDLGLGALDNGLELDVSGDDSADELAQQDISEFMEDDLAEPGGGLELEDAAGEDDILADPLAGSGGDFSEFEEELMGLKAEIEANPEGERLSDLLEREGVQSAVDDLEFELPQEEHNMTRAMGVSELLDEDSATFGSEPGAFGSDTGAAESLDDLTFGAPLPGEGGGMPTGLPSLDLPGGMIDDAMKARLGEVLDEMITASVRKAVQEEIPRLMEQLEKENH